MEYRRDIDGLRAVAVLPVLVFHGGSSLLPGGFVGVDIFFVISGFLITSLILADIEANRFSLMAFYERRARRIAPALFLVILCCIPFAWAVMMPLQLRDFGQSIVAGMALSANVLFWFEDNYFAPAAEFKPLLHTWSLSVEEQYYLFFPLLLMIFWRMGLRATYLVVVTLAMISFGISAFGFRSDPMVNYYLIPARAWELFVGSLCAFWMHRRQQKTNQWASLLGMGAIIFSLLWIDHSIRFPGVVALIPVIGTALIVLYSGQDTWVGKALSVRPLVGIGLISYSLYLWHQPLYAFARLRYSEGPPDWLMFLLGLTAIVLAIPSWRYVEQPWREKTAPFSITRSAIFIQTGIGVAALTAIGMSMHLTSGFPDRLPPDKRAVAAFYEKTYDEEYDYGFCYLRGEQTADQFPDHCLKDQPVVIVGDSHAASLAMGLRQEGKVTHLNASGCPFLVGFSSWERPHCPGVIEYVLNRVEQMQPELVIIAGNWSGFMSDDLDDMLQSSLHELKARGIAQVMVMGSMAQFEPTLPELLNRQNIGLTGPARMDVDQSKQLDADKLIGDVAAANGAPFFRPMDYLCDETGCLAVILHDGEFVPTVFDTDHLTPMAAYLLADKLWADESFAKLVAH